MCLLGTTKKKLAKIVGKAMRTHRPAPRRKDFKATFGLGSASCNGFSPTAGLHCAKVVLPMWELTKRHLLRRFAWLEQHNWHSETFDVEGVDEQLVAEMFAESR